jgi:hypothetical protein
VPRRATSLHRHVVAGTFRPARGYLLENDWLGESPPEEFSAGRCPEYWARLVAIQREYRAAGVGDAELLDLSYDFAEQMRSLHAARLRADQPARDDGMSAEQRARLQRVWDWMVERGEAEPGIV